ncbi:MAG TPA: hypothetical protein DCY85_00265 [Firmicutes bacterium]|nr:hypothetical protein [Bacillota bacterium]HBG44020.1 hypothetical protein [Bacillota bacterium]HBL67605.1 hypothetical protein [Bacillota bacterium]
MSSWQRSNKMTQKNRPPVSLVSSLTCRSGLIIMLVIWHCDDEDQVAAITGSESGRQRLRAAVSGDGMRNADSEQEGRKPSGAETLSGGPVSALEAAQADKWKAYAFNQSGTTAYPSLNGWPFSFSDFGNILLLLLRRS